MSARERPFKVEVLGTPVVDISTYVLSIDKCTDVGTGEPASAQIMINTQQGDFITETNSGATPLIDQYQDIRITIIDDNSATFSRIFYVDNIMPQQTITGQLTQLEMFARENYLSKVKMTGYYTFTHSIDMIKTIMSFYNTQRGTLQPEIVFETGSTANNDLVNYLEVPTFPVGTFDFGSQTNCYEALMQVITRLNLSVPAGGAGDFFELLFQEHPTDTGKIVCKIFSLGSKPTAPITVQGRHLETQSTSETKQPVQANIVVARGQADSGTYPPEIAEWTSRLDEFDNFPEWDNMTSYPRGAYVRLAGKLYQATDTTVAGVNPASPHPDVNWSLITHGDYIGSNFQRSPWTADKATLFKNYASNPNNALDVDFSSPAFPDSNLSVQDGDNYRNWADFRVVDLASIPTQYLYPATDDSATVTSRLPEGTRILVDASLGTLVAPLAAFRNDLIQLENGAWHLVHSPEYNDAIAVNTEANVYVWDVVITTRDPADRIMIPPPTDNLGWRSIQDTYLGLDCYHWPSKVECVDGFGVELQTGRLDSDNEKVLDDSGNPVTYSTNSAVAVEYTFTETTAITELFNQFAAHIDNFGRLVSRFLGPVGPVKTNPDIAFFINKDSYNYGWWMTLFEAPFPKSTYNSIGEKVGALYGGNADSNLSVLQLRNVNKASDGSIGYGSDHADELGEITGIHFWFQFMYKIEIPSLGTAVDVPNTADLTFRVAIYDTDSNVWTQDFNYRFLNDPQQIILPFSGFRIYRARDPWSLSPSSELSNFIGRELNITNIFQTQRIRRITIQWMGAYDEAGRYSAINTHLAITGLQQTLNSLFTLEAAKTTTRGTVDMFCFLKAPTAIAKHTNVAQRHLMEDIKEYPNVVNVEQLKNIAQADLDLATFRHDNFTVNTTAYCDLNAGDAVFYEEQDLISDTDKTGTPNTRKLAVSKINYTMPQGSSGSGGVIRHLTLVKRINA